MIKRKRIIIFTLSLFVVMSLFTLTVKASYTYLPEGEVASPEALTITKVIDSSSIVDTSGKANPITIGKLVDVGANKENVFLVDEDNSQVIVLNNRYEYITSIKDTISDNADSPKTLSKPQGIFLTDEYIYITDYENRRIAIFDYEYNFVREVLTPDDPTFIQPGDEEASKESNKFPFKPLKIAVDRTGRMYVFSENIFEGYIDLDPNGDFSRYVGANKVKVSAIEKFWLLFTTEEQKKAQGLRLSDTLVNLTVDKEGYIYSVSKSSEQEGAIKKLNSRGLDVLSRNGYTPPIGDNVTSYIPDAELAGSSEFIDIDVNNDDGYIVLDSTRGRIFSYDFEGNLLYIGGGKSLVNTSDNRSDLFKEPKALCYFNDSILVVDHQSCNLVVLDYTDFAKKVNLATHYYKEGLYDEAAVIWKEILALNSNYCLAYAGVGKAEFRNGEYESAMKNLKLGYDYFNYSKAYQQYRYEKLTVVFPYIMGAVIILIGYCFVKSLRKSIAKDKEEEKDE